MLMAPLSLSESLHVGSGVIGMCVQMCGESRTFLSLSAEHLQVPQAFPQIAPQCHGVRGIAFRAAPDRAVRVGPEKHR